MPSNDQRIQCKEKNYKRIDDCDKGEAAAAVIGRRVPGQRQLQRYRQTAV